MPRARRSRLKRNSALAAAAIALVGAWEGLRTVAYRDVVGVPTICFGETRGVQMGDQRTVDECKAMLGDALVEFEANMVRCIRNPDAIPDKPYMAFLSLSYNIGSNAFCRSTLVRLLNENKIVAACHQILRWNRAGGRVIRGLTNRRQAEHALCLEGTNV